MAHLLHIDSSFQGDNSVSRRFTAEAADAWRAANPDGTVTHRDLAAHPLPHFDLDAHTARHVAPGDHTPAQAAAWRLAGGSSPPTPSSWGRRCTTGVRPRR